MLRKLRMKLTVVCTVITAVILASVTAGAYAIKSSQDEENSVNSFRNDYNAVVFHLTTQDIIDWTWLAQTENAGRLIIHIEDNGQPLLFEGAWPTATPRGELITAARQRAEERTGFDLSIPPATSVTPESVFFELRGGAGERYRACAVKVPRRSRRWLGVILLKDMRQEDETAARQRALFAALAISGTLLLAAFSYWFTGRAIRPVEESQQRQQRFVADASHELRTPLAVVQTSASAILQSTPDEARRFSQTIGRECRRMSRFVDDLLLLARADARTWTVKFQPVDAETLLLNQLEQFEGLAAKKRVAIELTFDEDEPLPLLSGDEQRLSQVLGVLLDNAIRYSPEGGCIRLGAYTSGGAVRLTVSDDGPGIPDEDKKHVFERFYRADQARSDKEHYGLGLCIAWEIVALHRGKIFVRDNTDGPGCTFVVDLPVPRPSDERWGNNERQKK